MKKLIQLLSLGSVLVLGFANVNIVKADVVETKSVEQQNMLRYSQEDYELIKQKQVEKGVEPEKADELINKLKNGEVLDADILSPEQAVKKVKEVNGELVTITYFFPDGSASQTQFTDPSVKVGELKYGKTRGYISPNSISGGSCSTGTFTTSCTNRLVSYQLATYGFSFYADYTLVRYDYDSIQWAGNWNIWTAGGTYTNPSMRIIRSKETSNEKAEARLSATLNLANAGSSISRSLSLIVGKDSATDSWNAYY